MDFRLDDEQRALRDAAHALAARHFDLATVGGREGAPVAAAAWRAVADLGLFSLLAAGEPGGAVEATVVLEQLGAQLASGPLRWTSLAVMFGPEAGAVRVTGVDADDAHRPYVIEHGAESDSLLVLRADGVERCPVDALASSTEGAPLDPLTPVTVVDDLPRGEPVGRAGDARRLRLAGAILAAAELVGVAQGALDTAAAYALEREQFGVPIGSFQAVKHLLADMYVRVELARSATYAAAAIFDDARAGDVATATSAAKLLAGEAGIANGRSAVQVLGGMGFTWAMLPHYFLKRSWILDAAFGTGDTHALAVSAALEHDMTNALPT
jgi:alkylation response protein AidB-like acyl-CoA dehydrogenase